MPVLALYEPERIVIAAVGAVVFLAEVVIRVAKPGEHALSQNLKADALLFEHRRFITGVPPYDNPKDRFELFCAGVSNARRANQQSERRILEQTFQIESKLGDAHPRASESE